MPMTERSGRSEANLMSEHLIPGFLKNLVASRYTPWFITAGYIIGIGILSLTCRHIGDYEVETDFGDAILYRVEGGGSG